MPEHAEAALCEWIAARTGAPIEKIRRVRALARDRSISFATEQDYMDAYPWHRYEPEDFQDIRPEEDR